MPGGGKEDAGRVPTDTCETQREALHIRHLDSDDRLDCWRSVPVGGDGYKDWHSKEIGINQSPSFFFLILSCSSFQRKGSRSNDLDSEESFRGLCVRHQEVARPVAAGHHHFSN